MIKRSFKAKIILPTILVLIALVVTMTAYSSIRFSSFSDSLIDKKLVSNINSLNLYLNNSKANTLVAAVSMAENLDAVRAIKESDAAEIYRLFSATLDLYQIDFYTICNQDGTVLCRTHEPENIGDSVLNQHNITDAMGGRVSTYFESGTAVKVAVRTGAPVYDTDGTLIGVVTAGVRFDSVSRVDELRSLYGAEVTVFLGGTGVATTLAIDGERAAGTTLAADIAEIVLTNKQEYYGHLEISGQSYKTFCKPLINAENEAFAAVFLGIADKELVSEVNNLIRDAVIIGVIGLLMAIASLYFLISSISKPIVVLSEDMNNVADGNLHIVINVKSEDEVGRLSASLQKAVDVLQKLFVEISTMIDEHQKGNTDYCLNADAFLGDYQTLARIILQLADMGMKDQLTGISNRRSFDSRLDLEWKRAARTKTPISMLMLDVDNFKNYNDAFGHQQGDVALRTIAKTLTQSVKRPTDFCARWGGEEFVVLLPETDERGALTMAEQIRANIANAVIPCPDSKGETVTVSVGVSTHIPSAGSAFSVIITQADDMLYRAKKGGRNRICQHEGTALPG